MVNNCRLQQEGAVQALERAQASDLHSFISVAKLVASQRWTDSPYIVRKLAHPIDNNSGTAILIF